MQTSRLAIPLAVALFAAGGAVARADDDPPTWTPAPAPSDSYGWVLVRPQTRLHHAPRPRQSAAPVAPTTPAPVRTTARAPTRPRAAHRARQRARARTVLHPNVRPLQPQRTGAVLAARTVGDRTTANSPLVLIALALAIACFGLATPSAGHFRWHHVAVLTRYRPRELTLAGALLLVLAAVAIVLEGR